MDKCCRFCKYFDRHTGECSNGKLIRTGSMGIVQLSETGELYELIQEGFIPYKFVELENRLNETKLSKKAVKEIMSLLSESIEEAQKEWANEIDIAICQKFNRVEIAADVRIKNPSEFYCKYWE